MPKTTAKTVLAAAFGDLDALTLKQLRADWRSRFGEEPPRHRSRDLLARAFAYRAQVRADGDLSPVRKRKLAELARRFRDEPAFDPAPGVNLPPGSSLVKAWRGVRHEVRVAEDGFRYDGEQFSSLSQVARHITGTRWNGPLFFGLRDQTSVRAAA